MTLHDRAGSPSGTVRLRTRVQHGHKEFKCICSTMACLVLLSRTVDRDNGAP